MADITFEVSSVVGASKAGTLKWPAKGLSDAATSGPAGNGALPFGSFIARRRLMLDKLDAGDGDFADAIGIKRGHSWFQTLDDAYGRTELGIHPDGGVPGTHGCIGLQVANTKPWYDAFSAAGATTGVDVVDVRVRRTGHHGMLRLLDEANRLAGSVSIEGGVCDDLNLPNRKIIIDDHGQIYSIASDDILEFVPIHGVRYKVIVRHNAIVYAQTPVQLAETALNARNSVAQPARAGVTESDLEAYLGKTISDICSLGYTDPSDNHCAHFVSHVLDYDFLFTCRNMVGGTGAAGNIRVHEVFSQCSAVGVWPNYPTPLVWVLVFITNAANVDLPNKTMLNVPKKHVGIYWIESDMVYHYSNRKKQVVKQSSADFSHHYPAPDNAMFYGVGP